MKEESFFTIQQAAAEILKQRNYPIKAKEIAEIALKENLIAPSKAKNPVISLSQVLERNIRMNMGNNPKLAFINTDKGRMIGLPEMDVIKKNETCNDVHIRNDTFIKNDVLIKSDAVIKNDTFIKSEAHIKNEENSLISLLKRHLPEATIEKIELFMRIKKYSEIDYAIIELIKRGLVASTNDILQTLKSEFEDSDNV
ncbi:MAG: winged helix-turn-helix domain-containing protein [Clostridium sp.]|uniref:HTH domain-containing protein n=1 Tax=Clostridium sp. TaxID=1506 RepID=UPI0025B9E61F|nr:HTH domain-containing protein [Clostridium sp.]MCE5222549.1 winged helix-turn-helix domain-containing protein [Clostridium sp.]